jgi:hypothetical protein
MEGLDGSLHLEEFTVFPCDNEGELLLELLGGVDLEYTQADWLACGYCAFDE